MSLNLIMWKINTNLAFHVFSYAFPCGNFVTEIFYKQFITPEILYWLLYSNVCESFKIKLTITILHTIPLLRTLQFLLLIFICTIFIYLFITVIKNFNMFGAKYIGILKSQYFS